MTIKLYSGKEADVVRLKSLLHDTTSRLSGLLEVRSFRRALYHHGPKVLTPVLRADHD